MSDDTLLERGQTLELDDDRLRRLLGRRGSTRASRQHVRNTLAVGCDVIRRSAEASGFDRDLAAHPEARLDAVFRIQNVIAIGTSEGTGLHAMITDDVLPHSVNTGDKVVVDGPLSRRRPSGAASART